MKPSPSVPVAVERSWQLWLWLDARVADLPNPVRAGLGHRLVETTLHVLDLLVRASYLPADSPDRIVHLMEVRHRLTFLGLLLRGARERRYLSLPQYDHAAEQVGTLARMVNGWIRHTREPAPR